MGTVTEPGASAESTPQFTVFTPTFNRAHTLDRVYRSLNAQTFTDFEWLIVDNASTDGTEDLVRGWQAEAPFPIRYLRNQRNVGRHGSWNRAVSQARGAFFVEMRSADTYADNALQRLLELWESIPAGEREQFSAVTVLARDEFGALRGTRFPRDVVDSDSLEMHFRYRVRGENWGFQRTDVLRQHAMPEIEGYTAYMPESLVWRAVARRYRTRYVNEVLRTYWRDQAASSVSIPTDRRVNAMGRMLSARDVLNHDLKYLRVAPVAFVREAVAYTSSGLHAGEPLPAQFRALEPWPARALWSAALPAASVLFLLERHAPSVVRRLNLRGAA
jgi:glycosyltransferase involved in cell wall biosynthesis